MTESNRIEFKRELTRDLDIEKEVVAMLNYREGGIIYIGIDDNGKPVGVKDIDADMLTIKNRLRDGILPSPMGLFDVTVERIDDVPVIRLFVSSGSEKPYYKKQYGLSPKGCFLRVGTAAEPMTQAQIDDLYSHRTHTSLRNIPSPRQDLTFQQLQIYYQNRFKALDGNFAKTLLFLTDDGKYNYVAYLFADENDVSFKVAKYAGTDRDELIANNEYGYCCILKAADAVVERLRIENIVSTRKTYPYRQDIPLWDNDSIRELVFNAFIHNDYFREVPPKFELFSDHLEITSTGGLPSGLLQEEFFQGVSVPRNKEIMRIFRDVQMGESLGSGMRLVMKHYSEDNFVFMPHFIRISINYTPQISTQKNNFHPENAVSTQKTTQNHPENAVSTQKTTQKKKYNASSAYIKVRIIDLLRKDSTITRKRLAEVLGITEDSVKWHLQTLQETGFVRRVGPDKGGHWEIVEK